MTALGGVPREPPQSRPPPLGTRSGHFGARASRRACPALYRAPTSLARFSPAALLPGVPLSGTALSDDAALASSSSVRRRAKRSSQTRRRQPRGGEAALTAAI